MLTAPKIDRATLLLVQASHKHRGISGRWLESLGFAVHNDYAWRLWIPDEQQPDCESFLQLLAPDTPHGAWTAELVNVLDGQDVIAGIPKPMTTQGNVLFLLTAIGGRVTNPYAGMEGESSSS